MINKKDMEEALLETYGPEVCVHGKYKSGFSMNFGAAIGLPWEIYNALPEDGDNKEVCYGLREAALAMKQQPEAFGGIA